MKYTKRFIAGAICPGCGLEDKIIVYEHTKENSGIAECIRCGFTLKESEFNNRRKADQKKVFWARSE